MPAQIAIGELSRRSECNIETIRYYERIGLLPQPRREGGRFRRYDSDDVARLRFIRRAPQLGFTLDRVRALLRFADGGGDAVRAEARGLAAAHVAEIRAKIADLQAIEGVLSEAIRKCEANGRPRCPLIEVLSREADRRICQASFAAPLPSGNQHKAAGDSAGVQRSLRRLRSLRRCRRQRAALQRGVRGR